MKSLYKILKSNQNPEILKSYKNLEISIEIWAKKEDFKVLSVILLGC